MLSNSGWRPSPFDDRDLLFAPPAFTGGEGTKSLPHPFPPRSQGEIPCCVSVAVTTCMEALDAGNGPSVELAPLYHYFRARASSAHLGGLDLRKGLQAATTHGVCLRSLHDVDWNRDGALQRPSQQADADARRRRILQQGPPVFIAEYRRLRAPEDPQSWREALSAGYPLVLGFWVTPAYWRLGDGRTVHPDPDGGSAGDGHAVAVLGYDAQGVLCKDSRGPGFGDQGSWSFPYNLLGRGLIHEAWMIRAITYD